MIGKRVLARGETEIHTDSEEVESDTDFESSKDDGSEERQQIVRQPSAKLIKLRQHRSNARQIFDGLSKQAVTAVDFIIAPSLLPHKLQPKEKELI